MFDIFKRRSKKKKAEEVRMKLLGLGICCECKRELPLTELTEGYKGETHWCIKCDFNLY